MLANRERLSTSEVSFAHTTYRENSTVFHPATGTDAGTAVANEAGGVQCTQLPYYFGLTVGESSIEVTANCTDCG